MEDAFEEIWGPRCDEYEPGCPTCDAWRKWDEKMEDHQTIKVRVKNVYGMRMVYPECDKSRIFAQCAGHTVLTENTLDCIRRLGYLIEVVQEKVML